MELTAATSGMALKFEPLAEAVIATVGEAECFSILVPRATL